MQAPVMVVHPECSTHPYVSCVSLQGSDMSDADCEQGHTESMCLSRGETPGQADSTPGSADGSSAVASGSDSTDSIADGVPDEVSGMGTGASWTKSERKATGLDCVLHQNWHRAMALAKAAQQPIAFFHQGHNKQTHADSDQPDADCDEVGDDTVGATNQSAYSPYPVIKTEPFIHAWHQSSLLASSLLASAKCAVNPQHAPAAALHDVQVRAQDSISAMHLGWTSSIGYLAGVRSAVSASARHKAASMASGLDSASQAVAAESSRLMHWPWSSSSVSADTKVCVCSNACLSRAHLSILLLVTLQGSS